MIQRFSRRLALWAALAALSALVLPGSAFAQIRMTQLDEISQEITIKNFGGTQVDVTTYQMCREPGTYRALSTLTIVSGDLVLDPDEEVTVVYSFVLSAGTGLGLYLLPSFGTPAAMSDYMQYKGVVGFREGVAVSAGLWTAGTFADGASGPYFYTGDGTENGATFWTNAPPPAQLPALTTWGTGALGLTLATAAWWAHSRRRAHTQSM